MPYACRYKRIEYNRRKYAENRSKRLEYQRVYNAAHRQERLSKMRDYYQRVGRKRKAQRQVDQALTIDRQPLAV